MKTATTCAENSVGKCTGKLYLNLLNYIFHFATLSGATGNQKTYSNYRCADFRKAVGNLWQGRERETRPWSNTCLGHVVATHTRRQIQLLDWQTCQQLLYWFSTHRKRATVTVTVTVTVTGNGDRQWQLATGRRQKTCGMRQKKT